MVEVIVKDKGHSMQRRNKPGRDRAIGWMAPAGPAFIDKAGNVLRPAMLWLDRRAEIQAEWMKEKVGEVGLKPTGPGGCRIYNAKDPLD